jgi:hypothetical protein
MTRKRATVSEKKQRRAYVLRMIGEGWGLSELTTHVQDLWGASRAQARRYVKDAHVEFVNDYEVEDSGLLFACIDKLERVARTSMEKGQYSTPLVQSSCLTKCCGLVLIRNRCVHLLGPGRACGADQHNFFTLKLPN